MSTIGAFSVVRTAVATRVYDGKAVLLYPTTQPIAREAANVKVAKLLDMAAATWRQDGKRFNEAYHALEAIVRPIAAAALRSYSSGHCRSADADHFVDSATWDIIQAWRSANQNHRKLAAKRPSGDNPLGFIKTTLRNRLRDQWRANRRRKIRWEELRKITPREIPARQLETTQLAVDAQDMILVAMPANPRHGIALVREFGLDIWLEDKYLNRLAAGVKFRNQWNDYARRPLEEVYGDLGVTQANLYQIVSRFRRRIKASCVSYCEAA